MLRESFSHPTLLHWRGLLNSWRTAINPMIALMPKVSSTPSNTKPPPSQSAPANSPLSSTPQINTCSVRLPNYGIVKMFSLSLQSLAEPNTLKSLALILLAELRHHGCAIVSIGGIGKGGLYRELFSSTRTLSGSYSHFQAGTLRKKMKNLRINLRPI